MLLPGMAAGLLPLGHPRLAVPARPGRAARRPWRMQRGMRPWNLMVEASAARESHKVTPARGNGASPGARRDAAPNQRGIPPGM